MDLPEKGAHCTLTSCQVFDLLPIRCTACQSLFCKNHAQQDVHGCEASVPVAPTTGGSTRVRCELDGCGNAAVLKPAVGDVPAPGWSCDACRGAYCISHRHADAHRCQPVSQAPVVDKKAEAQALLTKLFSDAKPTVAGSATRTRAAAPTDPGKRAKLRAIELMRMKHKAVPADPSLAKGSGIQASDKIHLRVVYAPLKGDKVLWFRKDVVTGKAVDLAARALSVSREDGRGMRFVRDETDRAELKNDIPLGGQVEDGDEVQLVKED